MKISAAALALCLLSSAAGAAVITVNPSSDDGFRSDDSFTSFTLSGDPTDIYLRVFGAAFVNRAAIEFALSPLGQGDVVTSATFSIQSRGTSQAGGTFSFWGYSADGLVTAADATNTATLLHTAATQNGQPFYSFDVSAFIQTLADANATHAGILITVSPQGGFTGSDFVSGDSPFHPLSDHPRLTIDYEAGAVPEPASGILLAAGLAALAARRRNARPGRASPTGSAPGRIA